MITWPSFASLHWLASLSTRTEEEEEEEEEYLFRDEKCANEYALKRNFLSMYLFAWKASPSDRQH